LGCKEGTVKSRVNRARQRLQRQLARRGIDLAVLLAAVSVAEGAGRAAVPPTLAQSTIRFGLLVAAGKSAAGMIPTHIAALATGVTRAIFVTKTKVAIAVVIAVGLTGVGVQHTGARMLSFLSAQSAQAAPSLSDQTCGTQPPTKNKGPARKEADSS